MQVLFRLSHDGSVDVQRAAVLGLGRVHDPEVFQRLKTLVEQGRPSVRAAAARALAQQAREDGPDAKARRDEVIPVLQKAVDDSALEVVVEAADGLESLGALDATPVLAGLLHHHAQAVRETAAQALERSADVAVLKEVTAGLDDASATVRFSLVGALAAHRPRRRRPVGRAAEASAGQARSGAAARRRPRRAVGRRRPWASAAAPRSWRRCGAA